MNEKLEEISKRYEYLTEEIGKSEVIANQELWQKLVKEHSELEEIVAKYREYQSAQGQLEELKEMAREQEDDEEFRAMVEEELAQLEQRLPKLEEELRGSVDGITRLVFDVEKLEYISSAGLRVLLAMQKLMNRQGAMLLRNVNEAVMEVFEVTGFSDILRIE
mgnify:CR=1 FL=1